MSTTTKIQSYKKIAFFLLYFVRRLAAKLIDVLILYFAVLTPIEYLFPLGIYFKIGLFSNKALLVLLALNAIAIAYYAVSTKVFATTIGKHVVGLRVTTTDGRSVTWRQALLRAVFSECVVMFLPLVALFSLSGASTIAGFLVDVYMVGNIGCFLFSPKHRAIHDYIAKTVVTAYPNKDDETGNTSSTMQP